MSDQNLIVIHFDGGCRPTNPGNKYGSWEVLLDRTPIFGGSGEFGWGTNNEAEFEALEAALIQLMAGQFDAGTEYEFDEHPSDYRVCIFTDSTIVQNRIRGRNRSQKSEPEKRMYALNARCLKHLILFRSFDIYWRPRSANVERFGH